MDGLYYVSPLTFQSKSPVYILHNVLIDLLQKNMILPAIRIARNDSNLGRRSWFSEVLTISKVHSICPDWARSGRPWQMQHSWSGRRKRSRSYFKNCRLINIIVVHHNKGIWLEGLGKNVTLFAQWHTGLWGTTINFFFHILLISGSAWQGCIYMAATSGKTKKRNSLTARYLLFRAGDMINYNQRGIVLFWFDLVGPRWDDIYRIYAPRMVAAELPLWALALDKRKSIYELK